MHRTVDTATKIPLQQDAMMSKVAQVLYLQAESLTNPEFLGVLFGSFICQEHHHAKTHSARATSVKGSLQVFVFQC